MQLSLEQMAKLLNGNYAFSLWSLSMLITRLKGVYAKDPSEAALKTCADEMNVFINKFTKVLGGDYAIMQKL